MAEEYLSDTDNEERSAASIDAFLIEKGINQIKVELDVKPLVSDDGAGIVSYNEFTATATIEKPLVPGITDHNKDTYWSILAGSYNVSFAKDSLVTEKESIMTENGGKGVAEQNYYYFYWGLPEYSENTMLAHIFAWVDIDNDGKIDASIDDDKLESFKKVDTINSTIATSAVFNDTNTDYYKIEGGKVFVGDRHTQRFTSKSYNEPYNSAVEKYAAGTIEVSKTNSETGAPVVGAVFQIINADGDVVAEMTTNGAGIASYTGLPWGEYTVVESETPAGYFANSTVYVASFSGPDGYSYIIRAPNGDITTDPPYYREKDSLSITNTPIPPPPPEEETEIEGITDIIQVAGTTQRRGQDKIEVLGVAELPYTGMNATTPLIAGIILLAGLSLVFLSLRKKTASK